MSNSITIDGRDWYVPETNNVGQFYSSNIEIFNLRVYDYHFCPVNEDTVVLDVGANIGMFAVYCLSKGVKQVVSIEPGQVFESLVKNTEVYGDKSICLNVGAWAYNTKLEFVDIPVWSVQGCIKGQMKSHDSNYSVRSIDCNSIDHIVNKLNLNKIDFIKMDIEGSELEALQGAKYVIKTFKPKMAICLYHNQKDWNILPKTIFDFVYSYKYTPISYKETGADIGYFY